MVCFERSFGPARALSIPNADTSQHLTTSQLLTTADGRAYRSVIGLPLYLARERMDVMFAVTELATCMFGATLCRVCKRLRKVIGYLKTSGDVGVKLVVPPSRLRKMEVRRRTPQFWPVEDVQENGSQEENSSGLWRRLQMQIGQRTSSTENLPAVPFTLSTEDLSTLLQGASVLCPLPQLKVSFTALVSGCSDGIYIKRFLEFILTGKEVDHYQWTDNSAARQLVSQQGVGRIRHLSGKLLWVQDLVLSR